MGTYVFVLWTARNRITQGHDGLIVKHERSRGTKYWRNAKSCFISAHICSTDCFAFATRKKQTQLEIGRRSSMRNEEAFCSRSHPYFRKKGDTVCVGEKMVRFNFAGSNLVAHRSYSPTYTDHDADSPLYSPDFSDDDDNGAWRSNFKSIIVLINWSIND